MKLTITIPDDAHEHLKRMSIDATRAEGRTISPTTLAGQLVMAAIASDIDEAADMAGALADQPTSVEARKPSSDVQLPPVTRATFGPLGGATGDDRELLTRALDDTRRKRMAAGLDPATGLAPLTLATRAAVRRTGPRPMGFVVGLPVKPGPAPVRDRERPRETDESGAP